MAPHACLLLAALAALAARAAADGQCAQVPYVQGIDQAPTYGNNWGKCLQIEQGFFQSRWCSVNTGIGTWPEPPSDKAQKCLKFSRATIYRG